MRITGGTHRSRPLVAPRGQATRPTSDRVREALFSILGAAGGVEGASVLDLYAGTGALALEALSRGAESATVVEKARDALAALRANVTALDLGDRVTVVPMPVERATPSPPMGGFDLVLVDPPYALVSDGSALRAIERLVHAGALAAEGTLVLEHAPVRTGGGADEEEERGPDVAGLERRTTRRYGDSCLSFYLARSVP